MCTGICKSGRARRLRPASEMAGGISINPSLPEDEAVFLNHGNVAEVQ